MVSTQSGLRREIPLEDSHPRFTTMTDTDTLQQLQNYIAEMERHHKEELRKLKADHDQLEARVRRPQGNEHSAYTLSKCTQGESHPRRIINTANDLSLSRMHHVVGRTTHRHHFVDHIIETYIPFGWKPLNLERYDGTIDSDEHLNAFLTQANLYTNNDAIPCHVSPTSLKGVTLTSLSGLPPRSIDIFDTLVE